MRTEDFALRLYTAQGTSWSWKLPNLLEGQAGGSDHLNKGGGSNYLCLPNDPDNGKPYSYSNDVLYGAEYHTGSSMKTSGQLALTSAIGLQFYQRYLLVNIIMSIA
jgi:hypothetical protein